LAANPRRGRRHCTSHGQMIRHTFSPLSIRRHIMRLSFGVVVLYASLLSAADWQAPADGKFTEKQLENYIGAQKEIFQYFKAAGKALEGSKGLGAISVAAGINDKMKAILDKNGLQQGEYEWMGGKVGELLGVVIIDDIAGKSKAELVEQRK